MFFPAVGCLMGFLLLLSLPFLLILIFLNVVTFSFERLGLSPELAIVLLLSILTGSVINVPLTRKKVRIMRSASFFGFFQLRQVKTSGLAINLGGAVIPIVFSVYLLTRVPSLWPVLAATAIMTVICKFLARPVPGVGIRLPVFIPPVLATLLAVVMAPQFAASCAYIAGTMGTLIGADLLNLGRVRHFGGVVSIGGAGVFDGIFLVGIVSVLLTAFV